MPKKKTLKTAEKALAKARDAVADAKQSVKKLDRKTRRKAEALQVELKDAEKSARTSIKRAERTASKRAADAVQVNVHRITVPENDTAETSIIASKDVSSGTVTAPTYRELRERAKAQGVPGYSRMDKETLAAALARG